MSSESEANPSLYHALNKEMGHYNLSWQDIESIIVADFTEEETTGKPKVLTIDEAASIFSKHRFVKSVPGDLSPFLLFMLTPEIEFSFSLVKYRLYIGLIPYPEIHQTKNPHN